MQVFFIGENPVTWCSQKQKIVALSSCEAEYVAAAAATCQGLWLSRLVGDLLGKPAEKFRLLLDNQAAIALSKNPVYHDRSKHIDIGFHFIRIVWTLVRWRSAMSALKNSSPIL